MAAPTLQTSNTEGKSFGTNKFSKTMNPCETLRKVHSNPRRLPQ
jgi:hypothetical protein